MVTFDESNVVRSKSARLVPYITAALIVFVIAAGLTTKPWSLALVIFVTLTWPVFRFTSTTATIAPSPPALTAMPRPLTTTSLDELAGFGPGRADQPAAFAAS